MRLARIKVEGRSAVYHCMSRVVGGQGLLDDLCKEKLVEILWRLAGFCGVEVITYCMMSNHFHILVRVPETQNPSDEQLLERMKSLYGSKSNLVQLTRQMLKEHGKIDPNLRESMLERMGDVSGFMKEFKQRFSRWYNRRRERFGTLWAERFKSVVVEDQPGTVATLASYIDLNPVRAGLVEDPKDYRFCGYAAALAGRRSAQRGLMSFQRAKDWKAGAAEYRQGLYVRGAVAGQSGKVVVERERIKQVLRQGGQLSRAEVLRLRLRYLSDGVALGSREFVEEIFVVHREKFGPRRKNGARPIRAAPLNPLCTLRDLRVSPVS